MTQIENKVITIGAGGMNRKLKKFNRDGWRVVSTTPQGYLGAVTVVLERERPNFHAPQIDRKAEIEAARQRLAQTKAELAETRAEGKAAREQNQEVWRAKMDDVKTRAKLRKDERAATKEASKKWPPEPWA